MLYSRRVKCACLIILFISCIGVIKTYGIGFGGRNGNSFLTIPEVQQISYIAGFIDGVNMYCALEVVVMKMPKCHFYKFEECISQMTPIQIKDIVVKYLNENPDRRHLSMVNIFMEATVEACGKIGNQSF